VTDGPHGDAPGPPVEGDAPAGPPPAGGGPGAPGPAPSGSGPPPGASGDGAGDVGDHGLDAGVVDAEAEVVEAEAVHGDDTSFGAGAPGGDAEPPGPSGPPGPAPAEAPVSGAGGPPDESGTTVTGNHDPLRDDDLDAAAQAVEVDLDLLLREREQFLDSARRTQAEFENYRKQVQKRQDEAVVRSLGGFVEGLLPVLDACDAAVAHGSREAVEPILSALYGALEKEGLERIDPAGKPFDPADAEAVLHEPGEGGPQVVAETLRTGYRWRGRVLRPAMVKVTD
jgi:molecular chaperone GrpE